ncbi:MAG: hypothetical protein M1495_04840 [Bacteroidetes bacterium]|nr:hypothetical protein [Bacteroidota bacterium]
MKAIRLLSLVLFLMYGSVNAQLESFLGNVAQKDIELYTKPFATTLGTALNSGIYHSASIPDNFGFSLSLQTVYVIIPENQRTFTPTTPDASLGYDLSQSSSTIFGPSEATIYTSQYGIIQYPGGFNLKHATFPLPQISIHDWHTEIVVRFVPSITISDKKFSFYSLGLRHSVGQYFNLPIDISLQAVINRIALSGMVSSNSTAYGLALSKTLGILTPYAGLQFESTKVTFDYKVTDDQGNRVSTSIDLNGENKTRFIVGAALKLSFIVLNLDYDLGKQSNATAGISLEF